VRSIVKSTGTRSKRMCLCDFCEMQWTASAQIMLGGKTVGARPGRPTREGALVIASHPLEDHKVTLHAPVSRRITFQPSFVDRNGLLFSFVSIRQSLYSEVQVYRIILCAAPQTCSRTRPPTPEIFSQKPAKFRCSVLRQEQRLRRCWEAGTAPPGRWTAPFPARD